MAVLVRTRRLSNPSKRRVSVASYFNRKSVRKYNSKTVAQHLAAKKKKKKNPGRLSNPSRKRNYGTVAGRSWSGSSLKYKRKNYGTKKGRSFSNTKLTAAQQASRRASGLRRATRMSANPGKRLSLAQKLHFGTARQRAAARLALRRPNAGKYSKRKSKKANKRAGLSGMYYASKPKIRHRLMRKARRKNIDEIVAISLAELNPGKLRNPAQYKVQSLRYGKVLDTVYVEAKNSKQAKDKARRGGLSGGSWSSLKATNMDKRRKNTGMAKQRLKNTKSAKAARRRYRQNKGTANPGRRRSYSHRSRNTSHRRRRNTGGRVRNTRRRRNPVYAMRRINRGRRRNPIMGITSGTIGKALGVIGGALASKYVTQLALGGNNTGIMGYGGNLVASIALGWGAGKLTKSQDFGVMVTVGGLAALVLRILSDNTSIGQYVNLSLAGVGKGGDTGLGIIQDSSFPVPQVAQPGSMTSFITPRQTRSYVAGQISAAGAQASQMAAAGSGAGMGRMQGRMARRAIM